MEGKACLVTGANSGIGLETVRGLAGRGAQVTLACRDREAAERAMADVRRSDPGSRLDFVHLDLASPASVRLAADEFRALGRPLDVLVNNAGVAVDPRRVTRDGVEYTLAVNHLGHFLLTYLVLDLLHAAPRARIVNLASVAHKMAPDLNFDDFMLERKYSGLRAYARSKLANILFTRELARRLAGSNITANAVHPGGVRTNITANGDARGFLRWSWILLRPFLMSPEKGAATSLFVATSPELDGVSGEYFARQRRARTSAAAQDDAAAKQLWSQSERLLGVRWE